MRWLVSWMVLGIVTTGLLYLGSSAYCYVSETAWKTEQEQTMGFLAFWNIVVSVFTPIAILTGGWVALQQLRSLRASRNVEFVRTILREYIDEPRYYEISGRLLKYMDKIDQLIMMKERQYLKGQYLDQYDSGLYLWCDKLLERQDLMYFVNSVNHVSLFIDEKMAGSQEHDFYPFIIRNWYRLENFIAFEHARRRDCWWAGHFITLAIKMEGSKYVKKLSKKRRGDPRSGRGPIERQKPFRGKTCECMQEMREREKVDLRAKAQVYRWPHGDEEEMEINLRAANPTFDEGLAFARYADEVAEGFFRVMLGRRAEQLLGTAFAEPDHDLSYQRVTFAERDNVIVGMILGYTAEQHRRSSRRPLRRAAGWLRLRMRIVETLFAPMMRIVDSVPDGDFYVQFIAVDKELRGAGVGSVLMDFAEERARAEGLTRLSLDVSAKNEGARRFYERRGMNVESQWPKRLAIPGLKFYRMTKTL